MINYTPKANWQLTENFCYYAHALNVTVQCFLVHRTKQDPHKWSTDRTISVCLCERAVFSRSHSANFRVQESNKTNNNERICKYRIFVHVTATMLRCSNVQCEDSVLLLLQSFNCLFCVWISHGITFEFVLKQITKTMSNLITIENRAHSMTFIIIIYLFDSLHIQFS